MSFTHKVTYIDFESDRREELTLVVNNRYGIIDVLNENGERYSDKLFWSLYGQDFRNIQF